MRKTPARLSVPIAEGRKVTAATEAEDLLLQDGGSELKLKPVDVIPPGKVMGKYDKILVQFAKSNHQFCQLEGVKKPKSDSCTIREAITRLQLRNLMWAACRGNAVYLFKLSDKKR